MRGDIFITKSKSIEIVIDEEKCKGCGICIALCPLKVLIKSDKLSSQGVNLPFPIDKDKCSGCKICEYYCPDFAIYIIGEKNE
ncbi:MAG: 4Fe-4S binding protein [Nitrososphaerota archaeon]